MSKLEAMAYKMQPAGHEEPQNKRTYEKPRTELAEAFEKWLDWISSRDICGFGETEAEAKVHALTRGVEYTLDEAHALLLIYSDHPRISQAGRFISPLYNDHPDKRIVSQIEIETRLYSIGDLLAHDKKLVNHTPANYIGFKAAGSIVNFANTPGIGTVGLKSEGLVINYGNVENVGLNASGVVINLGKVRLVRGDSIAIDYETVTSEFEDNNFLISVSRGIDHCMRLKAEQCRKLPELNAYLDNLHNILDKGKESSDATFAMLEELGSVIKIHQDIREIFMRAGYDVA